MFPILGGGFLIVPVIMAIVGYKILNEIILNMADEVYDNGDELIFHRGNKIQRVKLRDIINIDHIYMSAPVPGCGTCKRERLDRQGVRIPFTNQICNYKTSLCSRANRAS